MRETHVARGAWRWPIPVPGLCEYCPGREADGFQKARQGGYFGSNPNPHEYSSFRSGAANFGKPADDASPKKSFRRRVKGKLG